MKINFKALASSILPSVIVGTLSGILIMENIDFYERINIPSFAPPRYLYSIVWAVMYLIIGIATYFIATTEGERKKIPLWLFAVGLFMNFVWPVLFFRFELICFTAIWLVLMFVLAIVTTVFYFKNRTLSGFLYLPYTIWLCYVSVLNISICLIN